MVELRSVSKQFGASPPVLAGISIEVTAGEFVSLIGPSGCGKSTLLRIVAGLAPWNDGDVRIDGSPPGAGASLAFVFQDPTLLPWLDARRNVELPLRLRGVPAAGRAAESARLLELVHMRDHAGHHPRQLSGGQRMRVSVARALALQPKLLLLDEPFGALDEMTRQHLNEELLAIRQQTPWTALFVTHSVPEAVFLSSRILVLSSRPGRIRHDMAVPLPYPRTAETRLTREFQQTVATVSRLLREVAT